MNQPYSKSIILFLTFSYHCFSQNFKRDNSGVNYAKFVTNPFRKLKSAILTSLDVSSPSECTFHCINNQLCYSVNVGKISTTNGKYNCELLNADRFLQPDHFVASSVFHHYNIKTPCMKHPCQNGGACSPIYSEDDYNCACAPEYSGRHCEMNQTVICEGATGQLSCSNGRVMKVLSANYGRLDAHTCPHHSIDSATYNTDCRAENSLARVQESCQDKANCQLKATNAIFGEPCKKIRKYLLVNYQCEM